MERLRLDAINRDEFSVSTRDGLVLIVPNPTKHKWTLEERWFRSVLCTPHGVVLSRGFPKFLNWHEDTAHHQDAVDKATHLFASEKLDGSLVIVSWACPEPANIQQYIRTRGSHSLGEFHEPVMKVMREKYPRLLDGTMRVFVGFSLLFEYTAPDNQIVVNYAEPDLTLLAVVKHGLKDAPPMLLNDPALLELFARDYGLSVVRTHDFESLPELLQDVPKWQGREGLVVTAETHEYGYVPFKVKSEWYLMLHALKFQMTPKRLYKLMVLQWDKVRTYDELQAFLFDFGYDFEISTFLKDPAVAFEQRRHYAEEIAARVDVLYHTLRDMDRKSFVFAIRDAGLPDWAFHLAMALYSGKETSAFVKAYAAETTVRMVQQWEANHAGEMSELLRTPTEFEENDSELPNAS